MKFICLTDLHLINKKKTLHGLNPSKRLEECLRDIEAWHKDSAFCVITGDLCDFAEEESYMYLKERLQKFVLPCFLLLGNHDDRNVFKNIFPNHKEDTNGFVQHLYENEDSIFLFLDTCKQGKNIHEGQMCTARLDWLSDQLDKAGNKKAYLFMHHPPFHIGIPYVDKIKLVESEEFYQTLAGRTNIRHIFFGHVHRMTYVNWRGFSFTSLSGINHQVPLVKESIDSKYSDEPATYSIVTTTNDQLTVHFNTFLHRAAINCV